MPKRRPMARDRRDPPAVSCELVEDRSSTGRQPADLIGRLSALPFHNGAPTGSPSLLCPSPEPEPNLSPNVGAVPTVGQTVALKRPA
jgi:hypothetical protein